MSWRQTAAAAAARRTIVAVTRWSEPHMRRYAIRKAALPLYRRTPPWHQCKPVVVLLVYRRRNAHLVRSFLGQLGGPAEVRLWALDEIEPSLEAMTVGVGPGGKYEIMNELYASSPVDPAAYVVVAEDDVVFLNTSLQRVLRTMQKGRINVAQPAHSWSSCMSWEITIRRLGIRATSTDYVEIGPLFVVDPLWRGAVLPFPSGVGMGWGLELSWYRLQRSGCRLGILDSCQMIHAFPPGSSYSVAQESERLATALHGVGLDDIHQLFERRDRWKLREMSPPWATRDNPNRSDYSDNIRGD